MPLTGGHVHGPFLVTTRHACALGVLSIAAWLVPPAAAQIETGTYTGDGANARLVATSAPPIAVIVKGDVSESSYARTETMQPELSKPMADGSAPVPGFVRQLTGAGFLIGSEPAVNEPGVDYHWIAFPALDGGIATGSYVGDGQNDHLIDGLGFTPASVFVLPDDSRAPTWKSDTMANDDALHLDERTLHQNHLAIAADGFLLTSHDDVNKQDVTYHYLAVSPEFAETGWYQGLGGLRSQSLDGRPEWVIVKNENGTPGVHRPRSLVGQPCHVFLDRQTVSSAITSLGDFSFSLGIAAEANALGSTYHYVSFGPENIDLAASKTVSDPAPLEKEQITYTVILANLGSDAADEPSLVDPLPDGVTYVGHTTTSGTYAAGSGLWSLPSLAPGARDSLFITALVAEGTFGQTITNVATANIDVLDADASNDTASVDIVVAGTADLELTKAVDDPSPFEGDTIFFTVVAASVGQITVDDIVITDQLPGGLTYAGHLVSNGIYNPVTGTWDLTSLAPGESATLQLSAGVDGGTVGQTLTNTATITSQAQPDLTPDNGSDSAAVTVQDPNAEIVQVILRPIETVTLMQGSKAQNAALVDVVNTSSSRVTLRRVTLTNYAIGPGSQDELDASWREVKLTISGRTTGTPDGNPSELPRTTAATAFENGTATVTGLLSPIDPGDTLTIGLQGGPSITARDGDLLRMGLADATSLHFLEPVAIDASWPLEPPTGIVPDGMAKAALQLESLEPMVFEAGTTRNVALQVVVPPNGYDTDELQRFDVVTQGDAGFPDDIAGLELFADDGDGILDPALDERLGPLHFTGARWQLTGLTAEVPPSGLRVFVTADITETASQGATFKLLLPSGADVALGLASDNDGPLDGPVENPFPHTISVPDRIILSAASIPPATVAPGQSDVALIQVAATNTYADTRTLSSLRLTNTTTGAPGATPEEIDGTVQSLIVRIDGNDDGVLGDIDTDPVAGSSVFEGGSATFGGMAWDIPAGATRTVFILASVSARVADGDVLSAQVLAPADVEFLTPTAVVASWPLDSGAAWQVDGMVADQIGIREVPPSVLAAGDLATLVMDVTIPSDGYLGDELEGFEVANLGTAVDADFDGMRLWRDGGDGTFTGDGDDADLGPLTWLGGSWRSSVLAEPVPDGGARLFVSVDVSDAPTDSASIRLELPLGGLTMASANDGPIDEPVSGGNIQLLSGSPLVASLDMDDALSTIGQSVAVTMTVRNVGQEDIVDVTPSSLTQAGAGLLTPVSGPLPATLDLAPGETGAFSWAFLAAESGGVTLSGSAAGTGTPSSLQRSSLPITSSTHQILVPVTSMDLFAVENMPFAIGLGETNVVPLTLTFENTAGPQASYVDFSRIRLRVEDESGAGIVPADQLARVAISEGTTIYAEKTDLETSGAEVDLPFDTIVRVTADDPVTLGLRLDIAIDAVSPTFRITIQDSSWFETVDGVGGGAVSVELVNGVFPVRSGLGQIVTEADHLDVRASDLPDVTAGQGHEDLELLSLELLNPSDGGSGADVLVGELEIHLEDPTGALIQAPHEILSSLRAVSGVTLLELAPDSSQAAITLVFSPPLTTPVDTPLPLAVRGDLSPGAPAGAFRAVAGPPGQLAAWDETTGDPVLVVYEDPPLTGGLVEAQLQATTLSAAGTGRLPEAVSIGAADLPALDLTLTHPGIPGTAAIHVAALRLHAVDAERAPLDTDATVDAVRVYEAGTELVALGGPFGQEGTILLPLDDLSIEAGASRVLSLHLDLEADAPLGTLELLFDTDGVDAVDANLGIDVELTPASGSNLPLTSGLTRLEPPADELVVGFEGDMPPVVAGNGTGVEIARVSLANGAAPGSGGVRVDGLVLRARNAGQLPVDIGEGTETIAVRVAEATWASVELTPADAVATLPFPQPVVIPAGEIETLAIVATFRSGAEGGLRIGLDADDVNVDEPQGVSVRVEAAPGSTFPFFTETGNFTGMSLEESYSSFPNPFAAGRDRTTFVFALSSGARVSLRVLDARGDHVVTLLDGESLSTGLHQHVQWDGRNGRGRVVRNGVYVADLVVTFDGGQTDRLRRKVAVLR